MTLEWISIKQPFNKPYNRWGHSSCNLSDDTFLMYGGYADSKYFNDIWVYKISQNIWIQVKINTFQQQDIPKQRSNCSLFYDKLRNRIIMFGGGSYNNQKLNDLWVLDIQQSQSNNQIIGQWNQIYDFSGEKPWPRTYHITENYYNFLIIQGGQTHAGQIQDIWILNLQTLNWIHLKTIKPNQPRKFHSSGIVKDKLFIFGGIYGKYQMINKIQYIDLKMLKSLSTQEIKDYQFQWKQLNPNFKEISVFQRWGHVSKSFNNKIYIFGGRQKTQLNDLIVFNPQKNSIKRLKTISNPDPRRKPCIWLIGSYLIINSGFNGAYLCDQHYINLRFSEQINKIQDCHLYQIQQRKQIFNIRINTKDNKYLNLNRLFICNSFCNEDNMINFLQQLGEMKFSLAMKYVEVLHNGVYNNSRQTQIFTTNSNKQINLDQKFQQIDQQLLKKYKITYSTNSLLGNKKKILFNIIKDNIITNSNFNSFKPIKVKQNQFQRISSQFQNDPYSNLKIQCLVQNEKPKLLKCCKENLITRSVYFKNVFEGYQTSIKNSNNCKQNSSQQLLTIKIPFDQSYVKIILIYCYYGHIIVPNKFNLTEFFNLYKISKKYSFKALMKICIQQIKDIILSKEFNQRLNEIFIQNSFICQKNTFNEQFFNQISQIFVYSIKQAYIIQKAEQNTKYVKNNNQWRYILQFFLNNILQNIVNSIMNKSILLLKNNKVTQKIKKIQKITKFNQANKQNIPLQELKDYKNRKLDYNQDYKINNILYNNNNKNQILNYNKVTNPLIGKQNKNIRFFEIFVKFMFQKITFLLKQSYIKINYQKLLLNFCLSQDQKRIASLNKFDQLINQQIQLNKFKIYSNFSRIK